MKTIRMIIKGKVQGVYYRVSAKKTADLFRIGGWVKNLPDGNVEIKANAPEEQLSKFIDWCRQGPARAYVEEVLIEEIPGEIFSDFSITR